MVEQAKPEPETRNDSRRKAPKVTRCYSIKLGFETKHTIPY